MPRPFPVSGSNLALWAPVYLEGSVNRSTTSDLTGEDVSVLERYKGKESTEVKRREGRKEKERNGEERRGRRAYVVFLD